MDWINEIERIKILHSKQGEKLKDEYENLSKAELIDKFEQYQKQSDKLYNEIEILNKQLSSLHKENNMINVEIDLMRRKISILKNKPVRS